MIVKIDKTFHKDVNKIVDTKVKGAIAEIIEDIKAAETLTVLSNLKKIVGYKNMYRIRLGDYRIGLEYIDNEIILIRFLHRKEIYKRWP
jgi:mRNA interferase RelE/StbE